MVVTCEEVRLSDSCARVRPCTPCVSAPRRLFTVTPCVLRPPRCVSTGPVVVRLAEMANKRERERNATCSKHPKHET